MFAVESIEWPGHRQSNRSTGVSRKYPLVTLVNRIDGPRVHHHETSDRSGVSLRRGGRGRRRPRSFPRGFTMRPEVARVILLFRRVRKCSGSTFPVPASPIRAIHAGRPASRRWCSSKAGSRRSTTSCPAATRAAVTNSRAHGTALEQLPRPRCRGRHGGEPGSLRGVGAGGDLRRARSRGRARDRRGAAPTSPGASTVMPWPTPDNA